MEDYPTALAAKEKYYRLLFERTDQGFALIEKINSHHDGPPDFRFLMTNPAFSRHTGLVNAAGKTLRELAPELGRALTEIYERVMSGGHPEKFERHITGRDVWVEAEAFAGLEAGQMGILFSDCSRRKVAEDEAKAAHQQLAAFIDALPIGVAIHNDLGEFIVLNQEMQRFLPTRQMPSRDPDRAWRWRGWDKSGHLIPLSEFPGQRVLRGLSVLEDLEMLYTGDDGQDIWTRVIVAPIRNDTAQVVAQVCLISDIDEFKRTEAALREVEFKHKIKAMETEQQREIFKTSLDVLEEERQRIAESLHNGIGQLLYGIKMSLYALRQDIAVQDYDTQLNYTSNLLSEAIKETRRVSHDLMPITLEQFGLSSAIKDMCDQLSHHVHFSCKLQGLGERLEKYLELAIYRTIQELMTNVIKHAEATTAQVHIIVKKKNIEFSVTDNGRGMAENDTKKPGIGLATIRSKIALLNGSVRISSRPEQGTNISVIIPKT